MKLFYLTILILIVSCKNENNTSDRRESIKKDKFQISKFERLINGNESSYDSTINVSGIWSKYSYPILFHRDKAVFEYSEEFNIGEKRHVTLVLVNRDSATYICNYLKMDFTKCNKGLQDPKNITYPSPIDGKSLCISDNFIGKIELNENEIEQIENAVKENIPKFSKTNYDYEKNYSISFKYYERNEKLVFNSNSPKARDNFKPIKELRNFLLKK